MINKLITFAVSAMIAAKVNADDAAAAVEAALADLGLYDDDNYKESSYFWDYNLDYGSYYETSYYAPYDSTYSTYYTSDYYSSSYQDDDYYSA